MDAERTLECMAELHQLTRLPRIGWVFAGVTNPESVADHCFETALIAYLLAQDLELDVDLGRVLIMVLFHEIGEVRITDMPRRSSPYVKGYKNPAERAAAADIMGQYWANLEPLLDEMHEKETLEGRLAEAAEELQIIAAALYYAKEGQGDMSEYRRDVANYEALGIEPAAAVQRVIQEKLGAYLGDKPFWELGYRREVGS